MDNIKLLIFLTFISISSNLFAQYKFEKESRVKPHDLPIKARSFIDSLNLDTKVKWYKEEGLNNISFEAKFKINKAKNSVEFSELGDIEDVEIEVDWKDIESNTKDSICMQLYRDCSNHKIEKVQKQYSGSKNDLFSLLETGNKMDRLILKYEIIARCKRQNKVDLYEYLFDHRGKLISTSKIVFKNSSHLEY